uniref:mRNA cap 0 methyltransferase domain-containing protein n=1 Tax=Parascaris equorum TaxID=6256 RepID=A0A914RXE6_PAREQ
MLDIRINVFRGCPRATVLDLCCGKGGDLLKWRIGNVAHLVATDYACHRATNCLKFCDIFGKFYDEEEVFSPQKTHRNCKTLEVLIMEVLLQTAKC